MDLAFHAVCGVSCWVLSWWPGFTLEVAFHVGGKKSVCIVVVWVGWWCCASVSVALVVAAIVFEYAGSDSSGNCVGGSVY